jgi:hypothetical protein
MHASPAPDGPPDYPLIRLAGACLIVLCTAVPAGAIDRITVTYGLRENLTFNDNLFFARSGEDKISDVAINTQPDLSILHDDGETRWLVRGSYRRESFLDNRDASGDYYALSGEFSRALSNRVSFSLLGAFSRSSSIELGRVLEEPGQRDVVRPSRGSISKSTFWSPSLTVFWSRRFRTNLTYEDSQRFSGNALNSVDRSLTLTGSYALSPRTVLQAVLLAAANRNSGSPFVDMQDTNFFVGRVGFSRVISPKLTVELSAGPNWVKDINFPERVTLIRNTIVSKCSFFGITCEPAFLKEPNQKVENLGLSLAFSFLLSYQWDRKTIMSLAASRSTSSGEGAAGTQQSDEVSVELRRTLGPRWDFSLTGQLSRRTSVPNEFSILPTKDPDTGEQQALDRKTFDLQGTQEQRLVTIRPQLNYRFNRWWSAFASWNWTEQDSSVPGNRRILVNQVVLGLDFRREEHY